MEETLEGGRGPPRAVVPLERERERERERHVGLYHIFPHYLISGTIFEERALDIKCVF